MVTVLPQPARSTAVVFGVGRINGLGAAIARRFAAGGCHVILVGRTIERLEEVAKRIDASEGAATPMVADVTDEDAVARTIRSAGQIGGSLVAAIYNAGGNRWGDFTSMKTEFFEDVWRANCLGAFLVGREAARVMVPQGRGSILYTSASAAWRGKATFAAFAAAKGGARLMAQAMAKELGPRGVHVATIVVDGVVDGDRVKELAPQLLADKPEDGAVSPEGVAETFWQIHGQPRTAWTHEIDLRPYSEPF